MKKALLLGMIILFGGGLSQGQSSSEELLQLQESEVTRLTESTDELRELYSEGLIARLELEKAEKDLVAAKEAVENTRAEIANAERLGSPSHRL